jgi:hypothetical protein
MALTAFLETLDILSDGSAHVVAIVTDNVAFKIRLDRVLPVGTTVEGLKSILRNVVGGETAINDLKALPLGTPIDLTVPAPKPPDPPVEPTPEELALRAFLVAYGGLQSGLRKVAAGVIQADDADLAALLKSVQTHYLPAYLPLG